MRRSILATVAAAGLTVVLALALGVSVLATDLVPARAAGRPVAGTVGSADGTTPDHAAGEVLDAARSALGLGPGADAGPGAGLAAGELPRPRRTAAPRPDATLALRDLFRALPDLGADDRRAAQRLLARPTEGAGDPQGDGYLVPAKRTCRNHICMHWVTSTADAPPSRAWVDTNLDLMNKVWRTEVRRLGYRAPVSDRGRGGSDALDVYLKELGSRGLYGYCVPEERAPGEKWLASGYCVLDNDFAQAQYGAPPRQSLRVTAAHEFFHAVQFAYDYGEDPWLMEATATWMEERVADDVNDNRQYLPYGQLGSPGRPLDRFDAQGFNQYGNWVFFEYLGHRFGNGVVRSIWTRAGAYPGSGHQYSTTAVKGVLRKYGGFASVYRSFVAANVFPARTYEEGDAWSGAPATQTWRLSKAEPRHRADLRINHLASRNVVVRPDPGLKDGRWRLRVVIDGPGDRTDPRAALVIRTEHGVVRRAVRLDPDGRARTAVGLDSRNVRSVTVALVNASTRFSCWHRTTWSCQGRARDDGARFTVRTVLRRNG
ncbi:MXAN_6640 family putative metalloprotease [Nocardioides sp.]|uniref:MXAN_6640 family putative metalloprotease n=1 Tax=Nocardioides sp. TaxID=35761 RepID=UPI002637F46C|nr:MXAN_6640 family putative metalloprotease [Nocardioides sp.]MDI6909607.1 hypothetical protein [Nocardioides sp.]